MSHTIPDDQLCDADAESLAFSQSQGYIAEQNREIAEACRAWRQSAGLTAQRAAELLGMPTRTYEGIEQGRGFRYPKMLLLAIHAFR